MKITLGKQPKGIAIVIVMVSVFVLAALAAAFALSMKVETRPPLNANNDNDTRINGAESEYYKTLDPPYVAKNGPIDDLSELLLIKGITPEMYWGPNSTNHPMAAFQARQVSTKTGLLPTTPVISAGMVDIFTPISTGQINLNTASVTALQMIPGVNENIANEIVRLRSGPDRVHGTEDRTPLNNN